MAQAATCEFAILDINLTGAKIDPVAEILSRGVPFIIAGGYGVAGVPNSFSDDTALQKLFAIERLSEATETACDDTRDMPTPQNGLEAARWLSNLVMNSLSTISATSAPTSKAESLHEPQISARASTPNVPDLGSYSPDAPRTTH